MTDAGAIVVVRDAALASSLELALLSAGFEPILFGPEPGLECLPLQRAASLIIDQPLLGSRTAVFVAALRARAWRGRVILLTDDSETLRRGLASADRVTLLEMPFQAATLIAALLAE